MLMLLQHPQDMPLTPAHHLRAHPSLHFCTPATYHAYAPAAPSRYFYNTATPCLPSPILMLLLLCLLPCLRSHTTLKIFLQNQHLISSLTPTAYHVYAPVLD
ncbi:hypothetical protein O181_038880 [Austropuccinia psidii MF-1]|uniref:Uncharacterized protein n=1 Tax=Austropuccinia psidii MF-1 TaxID=1389203 RepID=A0A9Q3HEK6_9BASI|nr:hypothetical protein [Austropuccinia psidii MF-1]